MTLQKLYDVILNLLLNFIEVTMFLLSDDLFRHLISLIYTFLLVHYWSQLGATMMLEPHIHHGAKAWSAGGLLLFV